MSKYHGRCQLQIGCITDRPLFGWQASLAGPLTAAFNITTIGALIIRKGRWAHNTIALVII